MFQVIATTDIMVKTVSPSLEEVDYCHKLCTNTVNTWQQNRSYQEKLKDTLIGKMCEKAFLEVIKETPNIFTAIDYDTIRQDDFKNHASLDLLLSVAVSKQQKLIEFLQRKSLSSTANHLTLEDNQFIRANGGITCELKSTRVTNRLLSSGKADLNKILNDDFLAYPRYSRKSNTIHNFDDYFDFCVRQGLVDTKETLMTREQEGMEDIYFRVYIQENYDNNFSVYLIGGIRNVALLRGQNIKKMIQSNKSEHAIYWASKLSNGFSVPDIFNTLNLKIKTLQNTTKITSTPNI